MMKIWRNGEIVDSLGTIDAEDRGVLLGDGLFETLAIVDETPVSLDRHLKRLEHGARFLGIPLNASVAFWSKALRDLIASEEIVEGSARITLLRGTGPRGVMPPVASASTQMISVSAGEVGAGTPVRAIVAKSTVRNERSPLSAIKSTNYLDNIVARMEADKAGADDAIMLNTQGRIAEATAANIFCVINGELVTPPVSEGALPGVLRSRIIEERPVTKRLVSVDDLARADEVFLTSSLSVRPVISLNEERVGDGKIGPVATELMELPRRAETP